MDVHAHDRRAAVDWARVAMAVAACIAALCLVVLTIWLVTAKQETKLYEADNVVCASQPFAITCFERKPR